MKAAIRKRIPEPVIVRVSPEIKRTNVGGYGAPRYVAVLDPIDTEYDDEFLAVIDTLSYREKRALSRALGVGYKTVVNWKQRRAYPNKTITAARVIAWGKAGKPITTQMPDRPIGYIRECRALARAKRNRALAMLPPLQ